MDLISPGRVLGNRYHLVEPLARGGMATVWIADDPVLSRRVAVKILRPDLAADDATRARFRNEAIAAARLNHANIVSTFDTGDDDGTAYIVMELVAGQNLRHLIDAQGQLPIRDVIRIGREVADALDAAHRAGLVHRDVKPANVLVPATGHVKVTDFGIAKATGTDELTRTGMVMGTARYLAPEQVNGRTADARTDVYALGLLLWEMCCGRPPFGGDTDIATAMARLTTSPGAMRAERPDVPRALDDLVHRCLARDPAKRFASAGAVRHALDIVGGAVPPVAKQGTAVRAASGTQPAPRSGTHPANRPPAAVAPAVAPRPPTKAAPARRKRRGSWLWLVLVFIVAAAAGVAAYLIVRDETGGNGGGGGGSGTSLRPASEAQPTVDDFDPQGTGTPGESPQSVAFVLDGSSDTAWSTEGYENFSAEKDGVGLTFDLGDDFDVSSVTVDTEETGWSGALYVSGSAAPPLTTLAAWGAPRAEVNDVSGTTHTFDVGEDARSVLLWFTSLPDGSDGRQHLSVTEVKLA